jgi:nucleotide-binding universal stress UspA family protein
MYAHLLVATDGSEPADRAVRHGAALAKAVGAKLSVCTVSELFNILALAAQAEAGLAINANEIRRASKEAAGEVLAAACSLAASHGVTCEAVYVVDRLPADGILSVAATRKCDLIVMGSHGRRGLPRLLLGSQAFEVVTRATVPVLIVR